ncbi:hypothetical protein [Hymenobacter coccineus]|uniref:Uncharacterized protein n=1 Tax=Hymenobacter coccineus TaxID=1908235 RepID=A0A1G1TIG5_9BACT|nr:hypothetical protein [Hymenobacter coccineus]OGX90662.1 hypothetical protein BEN49_06310 [Hymenobacter coccineus]
MLKLPFLALLLLLARLAPAQTPAQANKALFDKTVDELNFRTFETVYDKSFTRGKFPVTLRTAAARRQFDQFGDNAGLKKLFQNYNASAERYKNRFGTGPVSLAEFNKQLNSILRDRNFEFFIHGLPRDERVALVRAEERLIKQADAQFNAAGAPADAAAVAPDAEGPMAAPLTTNDSNDDARPTAEASETADGNPAATGDDSSVATPQPEGPAPRHNWLDYLTFLLSLSSFLLLLHLVLNVIPGLQRRIEYLAPEGEPEPDVAPPAPGRSLLSRLRDARPKPLRDDRYGDDDDEEDEAPDGTVGPQRPGYE